MERQFYVDQARSIKEKLREEVNGLVRFEVYPEVDTIVFKIIFKDFDFNYAINNIQELMYSGGFDEQIDILLKKYRSAVLSGFFKNERRKERDRREKLGITKEMLV